LLIDHYLERTKTESSRKTNRILCLRRGARGERTVASGQSHENSGQ
jgi:hypothetical protein